MKDHLANDPAVISNSLTALGISTAALLDSIPNQIPAAILGTVSFIALCVMIWKNISTTRRNNILKDKEIELANIEIMKTHEECGKCRVMLENK